MNPTISVLTSVHLPNYLTESIESILSQTFEDFEFIIVNDGDGKNFNYIQKILESYNDSRIKIIKNKKNIGLAKSLNLCLNKAKGDYFARHDGDDISLPNRFEKQLPLFKNKDVGVVSCWAQCINKDGNKIKSYWVDVIVKIPENAFYEFIKYQNCVLSPGSIFSRSVYEKIGYFDPEVILAQDYNYWLRAIPHFKFKILPEILVKKREHNLNVWKKGNSQWINIAKRRAISNPYNPSNFKF